MCSMSALKCPLCAQTNFPNIDALRISLIKVANGPLVCPICHELFLGLDKLTIHLFSHTNTMAIAAPTAPVNTTTATSTIPKTTQASAAIETADKSIASLTTLTPKSTPTSTSASTSTPTSASPSTSPSTSTLKRGGREKKPKKARQQCDVQKSTTDLKFNDAQSNAMVDTVGGILEDPNIATSMCPSKGTASSLSTAFSSCDICELTFRDADLRDMHCRLVHRNLSATTTRSQQAISSTDSPMTSSTANEFEFKCHLCTKSFKMKGSLRVHLKVVHLPQATNMPKLSICDRIRHKETNKKSATSISNVSAALTQVKLDNAQQLPKGIANLSSMKQAPPTPSMPSMPSKQQPLGQQTCNIAIASTNCSGSAQLPNSFTFGTLTLLPTSASVASNLLNIGASGVAVTDGAVVQAAVDSSALNSNVLVLFNANTQSSVIPSAASASAIAFKTENQSSELDMDVQNKGCAAANPKAWECDVCGKAFTTKYFLKKHKRLHTGEMPYTCEICARTFTFQQSYHKHLLYHSNEKPHVCSTCGRAFKELSTLHNHERIHSGEKPFKCEVCGKCFRQRVSFLVHTRIHTGVRPYTCDVCAKSFRYKVSQRTHKCQPLANDTTEVSPDTSNNVHNDNQSQTNGQSQFNERKLVDPKATVAEDISECFITEFLENTKAHIRDSQCSPASAEIASITDGVDCHDNAHETEALLTKAIDDIVVESCNKMGIGSHVVPTNCLTPNIDDGCSSPTQRLQNMRLYSPQLVVPEMIDGAVSDGVDIFPRFLLDDVETNML